jgi:predicted nucleic acid-binding protein
MHSTPPATTTLLDACAVLSLYATGRIGEIVASIDGNVGISDVVLREALYVRRIVDGVQEPEPVDLAPLIATRALLVYMLDGDDEAETIVDLAVDLDDGEATTGALAIHRGWVLVTDDRKAERILAGRVQMRSTLDIIKAWSEREGINAFTLRQILEAIYDRGYQPPRAHPLKPWWDRHR